MGHLDAILAPFGGPFFDDFEAPGALLKLRAFFGHPRCKKHCKTHIKICFLRTCLSKWTGSAVKEKECQCIRLLLFDLHCSSLTCPLRRSLGVLGLWSLCLLQQKTDIWVEVVIVMFDSRKNWCMGGGCDRSVQFKNNWRMGGGCDRFVSFKKTQTSGWRLWSLFLIQE